MDPAKVVKDTQQQINQARKGSCARQLCGGNFVALFVSTDHIDQTAICIVSYPFYQSCAVRRMSYKMGSVSSFWCHICACKFMLAYIYHALYLGCDGGRGLFEMFSSSCKNSFVVFKKCAERFKESNILLKCIQP